MGESWESLRGSSAILGDVLEVLWRSRMVVREPPVACRGSLGSSGAPRGSLKGPSAHPQGVLEALLGGPWGVCATPRVALREALGVFGETSGDLREASGVLGEAQEVSRACRADRGNMQKTCVFIVFFAYEVVGQSSGGPQKAFGWPPRALGRPRRLLGRSWVSPWAVLGGFGGALGGFGEASVTLGGSLGVLEGSSGCLRLPLGSRCVEF